jgi:GH25 family lysozyme M1 (1,4-beta-N-acetylmuramidase)
MRNRQGDAPLDLDDAGIAALMQSKEAEVEQSIKDRMRELVTGEDGSPLKMLRSFFPENLIYSFENEYVFAPVLDEVTKHSLLDENFQKTEEGLMQYVENGTVTSHKGIDVSKYQGDIDWNAVREEGIEYAFIRLGLRGYESGKIVLDDFYDANMKGANEAGVRAGVYFFTQAVTVEEAQEEAAFVIEHLAGYDVSCPVVFDVERISGGKGRADQITREERTAITIAFCEAVRAAGYTPMIYGNVVCFTQLLDMPQLNAYEKWYAFYDDYMYMPYEVTCWQYTEKGRVDGIPNNVDLNISFKVW